jgi:hypothetical protein
MKATTNDRKKKAGKNINVYVVMGNANTRKSSTIRALTGIKNGTYVFDISTKNGVIPIYAKTSALQEAGILPKDFVQIIRKQNSINVLIALRIKAKSIHPTGLDYLIYFNNLGWNIQHIFVLSGPIVGNMFSSSSINSTLIPTNEITSVIRKRWKWL